MNYDGFVITGWFPAERGSAPGSDVRVVGRIRAALVPRALAESSHANDSYLALPGESKTTAQRTTRARVSIQIGITADNAVFTISIHSSVPDVLPSRLDVVAPTGR